MFRETQQFRQKWLWILIIIIAIGLAWPLITQFSGGKTAQQMPLYVTILIAIIPIAMIIFMYVLKLDTEIMEDGIQFSFSPVVGKKLLPWKEVDTVFIRKYNAIMEYGGWGIRNNMGKMKGRALSVSGDMGIQLIMKDGKRLLIGTRKPEEVQAVLTQLARKRIVKNEVV
jgi:hypothetical protein